MNFLYWFMLLYATVGFGLMTTTMLQMSFGSGKDVTIAKEALAKLNFFQLCVSYLIFILVWPVALVKVSLKKS